MERKQKYGAQDIRTACNVRSGNSCECAIECKEKKDMREAEKARQVTKSLESETGNS